MPSHWLRGGTVFVFFSKRKKNISCPRGSAGKRAKVSKSRKRRKALKYRHSRQIFFDTEKETQKKKKIRGRTNCLHSPRERKPLKRAYGRLGEKEGQGNRGLRISRKIDFGKGGNLLRELMVRAKWGEKTP